MPKKYVEKFVWSNQYAMPLLMGDWDNLDANDKEQAHLIEYMVKREFGETAYIAHNDEAGEFADTYPIYYKNKQGSVLIGKHMFGRCMEYHVVYDPWDANVEANYGDYEGRKFTYYSVRKHKKFPTKEKLLPWQKLGLMFTATGYGAKIPTTKMVHLDGRWRRIYASVYSNMGSTFVRYQGEDVYIDDCNLM